MNFISRLSSLALKWLAVFVTGAALLGAWQPEFFSFFTGHVPLLLAIIIFGMGATLTLPDFGRVLKHPGKIFFAALLQYTIMPVGAWGIAVLFSLPPELAVGLVLLGSCPGGTASNVITYLARGDVALSVTMTAFSTMLAPLVTPLLVWSLAGHWLEIPVAGLFRSILTIVILPIALGLACRSLFPRTIQAGINILPIISMLAICLIVGAITGQHAREFFRISLMGAAAILAHNVLGLGLAWTMGWWAGFKRPQLKALTLEVGMQNSGLAATLALAHIHPLATLPGVLASVWQNITGPVLASFWTSKPDSGPDALGKNRAACQKNIT
ncbi:bile acid:sodium symporter family protein [Desulfonatronovibrio hydrogenovorans]|uniref:bile acid:sodium symporter family protein n=1 Tax=Desulfonatronovibrio hydrogenovorans TaxID=53245 RepID=UPI000491CF53|nr:bile acid:sodium symporter family protein [Desulfonatronovibrio hydrogenovorans]